MSSFGEKELNPSIMIIKNANPEISKSSIDYKESILLKSPMNFQKNPNSEKYFVY